VKLVDSHVSSGTGDFVLRELQTKKYRPQPVRRLAGVSRWTCLTDGIVADLLPLPPGNVVPLSYSPASRSVVEHTVRSQAERITRNNSPANQPQIPISLPNSASLENDEGHTDMGRTTEILENSSNDDLSIQAFGDGKPGKRFSNGVRATLKAIRTTWFNQPNAKVASALWFAQQVLETYNGVAARYFGNKNSQDRRDTGLQQHLVGLEKGARHVTFPDMLAFAELLTKGFPTGLLFLYTNVVSDAARGSDIQNIRKLLQSSRAAIDALDNFLDGNDTGVIFKRTGETEDGIRYYAKLGGLRVMVNEFEKHQLRHV
jgi:hypothetical protein